MTISEHCPVCHDRGVEDKRQGRQCDPGPSGGPCADSYTRGWYSDEVVPVAERLPVERLQAVTVKPEDIIIATIPVEEYIDVVVDEVRQGLQKEFPDNKVVVLAGLELWVGRRPGAPT